MTLNNSYFLFRGIIKEIYVTRKNLKERVKRKWLPMVLSLGIFLGYFLSDSLPMCIFLNSLVSYYYKYSSYILGKNMLAIRNRIFHSWWLTRAIHAFTGEPMAGTDLGLYRGLLLPSPWPVQYTGFCFIHSSFILTFYMNGCLHGFLQTKC